MEKIDFKYAVDYIFENKSKYKDINDYYRDFNFFMVNRKFAIKEIDNCEELNKKFIDKASALDWWFLYFKKTLNIPGWYWIKNTLPKQEKKKSIDLTGKDNFIEYNELREEDVQFLEKYYADELKKELKKYK